MVLIDIKLKIVIIQRNPFRNEQCPRMRAIDCGHDSLLAVEFDLKPPYFLQSACQLLIRPYEILIFVRLELVERLPALRQAEQERLKHLRGINSFNG